MICVYATNEVVPENQQEFIEVAKKLVEETVKEDGCISYEFCQDGNNFVFFERWESKSHLDAHMKTSHFVELVPKVEALRVSGGLSLLNKLF